MADKDEVLKKIEDEIKGIARAVEHTIRAHTVQATLSLDDLLKADQWARRTAVQFVRELSMVS